jgi:hypothetical protein
MTAIAIPYTSFGFAIAADGRQRWADQFTRDNLVRAAESDSVQKIFEIKRKDAAFAYTLSGDVASRDRSFDLAIELQNQLAQIQRHRFFTARRFIETLSGRLESAVHLAMRQGRAEEYPACEITLAGYFRGQPRLVNIQFQRHGGGLRCWNVIRKPPPGLCFYTGSHLIANLVSQGDERFAQFCPPLDEKASLQAAVEHATGYIQASSSALARQLDPECDSIGGRIHVATVTPPIRSLKARIWRWITRRPAPQTGFQWIRPPLLS